jgi:glycosyltransferase involved in cell wall biosynthesis
MHVVHVYDGHEKVYRGRGSVPGVVWNVARETAARGHDVTVLERRWNGLGEYATHEGVAFERMSLRTGAKEPWTRVPYEEVKSPGGALRLAADRTNFALQALRRLRGLDPDVIHVHLPFAANVMVTVAPWLRDRMVYTAHMGDLRMDLLEDDSGVDVPGVLELFSPDVYLAERVAQTTVLNPEIRDAFVEGGVPPGRVEVVPNGVDLERFGEVPEADAARVREAYGLDDRPFVLYVGTVMPRKGVTELVRALGSVAEREDVPTPRAILAGENTLDEGYTARVEELIAELGLEENVDLTGFVDGDDLPALYALADVFVVSSLEEGFGMTAVEAMAAGTPVVGTRVGGLPTIIEDGKQGRLVEPGDAAALADALAEVLGDPELRERMAERARSRARDFSWEAVGEQVEAVYHEVGASSPPDRTFDAVDTSPDR